MFETWFKYSALKNRSLIGGVIFKIHTHLGGINTHPFTCKLHHQQSGESAPTKCCKLSLKSLSGVDNKIMTFTIYIYKV